MRRLMRICCFALLIVLLFPVTAQADVIYEPFDSFYEQHRAECSYVGRRYTANGPNGTVTLYETPLNPNVEKEYKNGTVLYVSYTYQTDNGILWACCDNWDDNMTGWVPVEYLELIYDGISFKEEFGDSFIPIQMTLEGAELDSAEIYFWEYPGSTACIQVLLEEDYRPDFHTSYTDEMGNKWVQCSYYFGIKGYWVNLSNPTADYKTLFPDVPEETLPTEMETVAKEHVEEIKPDTSGEILVVTLAVAAVVVITAVMLVVLKKRQK